MPYHVIVGNERFVVEQDTVLVDFLSKQNPAAIIIVKAFDYVERNTSIYGSLPGMLALPPVGEAVVSNEIIVKHLTVNGDVM